jgi:hypothetical protein
MEDSFYEELATTDERIGIYTFRNPHEKREKLQPTRWGARKGTVQFMLYKADVILLLSTVHSQPVLRPREEGPGGKHV